MPKITTVKVIPNPYSAIDADGIPQGAVGTSGSRRYVGARVDEKLSEETGKTRFFYPDFPKRDVELPLDGLVANAIREGSLLVTSIEDARKVGIPEKKFLAPDDVLKDEHAKAEARYRALAGADAQLRDVPTRRVTDVRAEEAAKAAAEGKPAPEREPKNALKKLQSGGRVLSGTSDQPLIVAPDAKKD